MAPPRPIRDLSCDKSFREAAGKVIWTRFEEMMSFRDAALAGKDPEGVHDMRVATRRLRAALELFGDVFPKRRLKPLLQEVKGLADALGEVRDRDVLIDRLRADLRGRPPAQRVVLRDLMGELEEQRKADRRNLKGVIEELEGRDFSRQFLATVAQETM